MMEDPPNIEDDPDSDREVSLGMSEAMDLLTDEEIGPIPTPPVQQEIPGLADVRERRVLVGYDDSDATRSIRLTLEGMRYIQVDSSPSAERIFERAMQYSYDLFIFGTDFEEISGEFLYSLIDKAYRFGLPGRVTAPGLVFIHHEKLVLPSHLRVDVRIKGTLVWPFSMDELLAVIDRELPGTAKGSALL